jgi:predicted SPOUT superfamily RNA methylase MTH1|tara:strand:+ start:763 stop:963 length:201 start_codon:yes stop_codon:yes gene_type:complete
MLIFDSDQSIPLVTLEPRKIIDFSAMHPINNYTKESFNTFIDQNTLVVQSEEKIGTGILFGGFNPF